MFIKNIGIESADFGGIVKLDSYIVVKRAYRQRLLDEKILGSAQDLQASGGIQLP